MTTSRFGARPQDEATTARTGRWVAAAAAGAALCGAMRVAAPAAQAGTSHCLIINQAADASYTSLPRDAALFSPT